MISALGSRQGVSNFGRKQCLRYAEEFRLGLIAVGDEAALHHFRGSRDGGKASGKQAAGTRFGHRHAAAGKIVARWQPPLAPYE